MAGARCGWVAAGSKLAQQHRRGCRLCKLQAHTFTAHSARLLTAGPQILVQVTNEEAVLEAIRGVLSERARGEELVMFDPVSLSGAGLAVAAASPSVHQLLVLSAFPTRATAAG